MAMNEIQEINGIEKPFLDWCGEYGASALQVRALMSLGAPFEEALQTKAHRRIVLIAMNGQTKSLTEWCKQYGAAPSTIKKRISAGYTLPEAFESKKYGTNKIKSASKKREPKYTVTKPFLDWCGDYAADPLHVRAAMSTGYSLEYALRNIQRDKINQLVMRVEGQIDTFLILCDRYKKAYNTIRRRVSFGLTLEDAFVMPQFKKGEIERLIETGRANETHSITKLLSEWCRDYNRPRRVVEQRLEAGMPFEQALATVQSDPIELNNGRQVTLAVLCGNLGLDVNAVKKHMTDDGMSILEALNEAAVRRIRDRFPVDGKALKEARESAGVSQSELAVIANGNGDFKFTKYVIHALEHGKRMASEAEWQRLKESLQLSAYVR